MWACSTIQVVIVLMLDGVNMEQTVETMKVGVFSLCRWCHDVVDISILGSE